MFSCIAYYCNVWCCVWQHYNKRILMMMMMLCDTLTGYCVISVAVIPTEFQVHKNFPDDFSKIRLHVG